MPVTTKASPSAPLHFGQSTPAPASITVATPRDLQSSNRCATTLCQARTAIGDDGHHRRKIYQRQRDLLLLRSSPPSPRRRHYRACRQRCLEPMALPKASCTAPFFVFCETGPPSNLGHAVLPSTLRQPPPEVLPTSPLDPTRAGAAPNHRRRHAPLSLSLSLFLFFACKEEIPFPFIFHTTLP
ncbi:hypothetical protein LR48_Vigan01g051900 [Vigna angularis]|uniref:Uncharacterized protein n=1 Tax=Phaseolus angularis TaxID=3914 RepID=A0A0L9TLG0_PHAAN|nr:hypothetical protein LR48_Vigan01g051900 [Vigna angularis]